MSLKTNVLVLCDSGFIHLCDNPYDYVTKLKDVLAKRYPDGVNVITVGGKFGLSNVDADMKALEVEDKNKTVFGQSIENISGHFNEMILATISGYDAFLDAASEAASAQSKTIMWYKYVRRQ